MNKQDSLTTVSINWNLIFIFIFSSVAMIASLYLDYIVAEKSCKFCVMQRIAFMSASAISLFGIFISNKTRIGWVLGILNVIILFLACYHLSIQFGLLPDPCVVKFHETYETFLNSILNTSTPCSKQTFVLGIPISGWSASFSVISLFFVFQIVNTHKHV